MDGYFLDESEDGYGPVFVPRGVWQTVYKDLLEKEQIRMVRLSRAMGWRGTDVRFLEELPGLQGVEIYAQDVRDASTIATLPNLQLVGLECDLRVPIDFQNLTKIKVVKARWKTALASVLRCSSLEHLNIIGWHEADVRSLTSMVQLTKLQLTSRKLVSLDGIELLVSLRWLDLHACPRLKVIENVKHCSNLSHLEITSCKAVASISSFSALKSLRELYLDNDGDIQTLAPLKHCSLLERLSFLGTTKIVDGRLSVVESLPRLETLRFAPRHHYDRAREEILRNINSR